MLKKDRSMRKKRSPALISESGIKTLRKKRPISINIGKLISDYLMHSYLYYEKQKQIICDHEFDGIVDKLLENFDKLQNSDHIHKHLIDKSALESYTGFSLIGKFPNVVKICAIQMLDKNRTIQEILTEI